MHLMDVFHRLSIADDVVELYRILKDLINIFNEFSIKLNNVELIFYKKVVKVVTKTFTMFVDVENGRIYDVVTFGDVDDVEFVKKFEEDVTHVKHVVEELVTFFGYLTKSKLSNVVTQVLNELGVDVLRNVNICKELLDRLSKLIVLELLGLRGEEIEQLINESEELLNWLKTMDYIPKAIGFGNYRKLVKHIVLLKYLLNKLKQYIT